MICRTKLLDAVPLKGANYFHYTVDLRSLFKASQVCSEHS